MKEKLKKFKVIIIGTITLLVLLFLLIGYFLFFHTNKIKQYKNEVYSIEYDSTWKLKEKKKNYLLLKHGKKSKIEISMKTLEEEVRYNDISTFIEDIQNAIEKSNSSYQIISKKKDSVTKRNLEGYKLLYEGKNTQSYVVISKYNDKLFTIIYEAKDEEFDILLDSVSFIINQFSINDDTFDLNQKLEEIKTTGITYSKDKSDLSSKKTERQIANQGYIIKYKLSEDILKDEFNSYSYYNNYKDKDKNQINLDILMSPVNIYEYLTNTLMKKEKSYKKIDDYKNVKTEVDKIRNHGYNGYIYKISYEYESCGIKEDGSTGDKIIKEEDYFVLYEIDPITTLIYEIKAHEKNISKDLIENLEITSKQKYGAYITRNIENNNIVNTMKTLKSDTKYSKEQKYYQVTLFTPQKYYERYYDNNNIYESRYFGLDFDKENEEYKTKVHYILNHSSIGTDIKLVKENINSKKNASFTYVKDITINKNTFKYYKASYTSGKTKYNNAYLFLELFNKDSYSNSIYLEISTKDDIIKEDMIEGLLNMKIEIKDYKN